MVDMTYGLPLLSLTTAHKSTTSPSVKVFESGVHSLWHLPEPEVYSASDELVRACLGVEKITGEDWEVFWDTFKIASKCRCCIISPENVG